MASATPGDAPPYDYQRLSNNIAHVSRLSAFPCAVYTGCPARGQAETRPTRTEPQAERAGTHAVVSRFHHQFIWRQCPGKAAAPRVRDSDALHKRTGLQWLPLPPEPSGLWRRRSVIVTACLLAVAIGIGTYLLRRGVIPAEASRGQPPAVPVSVATAARRDVPIHLTGLGTVQATFTVGIHSQVDGKLQEVLFKEGQHVKKGDVLAKIDPRLFQAALDQAKAKKAQDEAQLVVVPEGPRALPDARRQGLRDPAEPRSAAGQGRHRQGLDRGRRGRDRNRADPARLHRHQGAERRPHGRAPGRSRQHRARLRCRLDRHPGAGAARGSCCSRCRRKRSTTCARRRSAARSRSIAYDRDNRNALSTGTLATIDNLIDQTTASYKLKATFANDDEKLWPGEFVNARAAGRHAQERAGRSQHRRSSAARRACSSGPSTANNTAAPKPIKVGPSVDGMTIVTSGLNDGERVVTGGQYKLRNECPGQHQRQAASRTKARIMNLSEPFIRRPIATTLLMAAVAFVGIAAFPFLPVAPLPQVDFPTIQVTATWQGASAETMATSVAAPLERQFAQIPGITQMTSLSALGATTIVIQFDLNRNIDSAAQDVQAAITVAGKQLPQSMTTPPSYKKVNPADSPILLLSLRSDTIPLIDGRRIRRPVPGAADLAGGRRRAGVDLRRPHAVDPHPGRSGQARRQRPDAGRHPRRRWSTRPPTSPRARSTPPRPASPSRPTTRSPRPEPFNDVILAYRNGAPIRVRDVGQAVSDAGRPQRRRLPEQQGRHHPRGVQAARRQRRRHRRPDQGAAAAAHRAHPAGDRGRAPCSTAPRRSAPRSPTSSSRSASPSRLVVHGDPAVPAEFLGDAHPERHRAAGADRLGRGDVSAQLQPRQPVADGADHRGRLRGRRRHRRGREHLPPHRGGRAAVRGRASRARARSASRCCRSPAR